MNTGMKDGNGNEIKLGDILISDYNERLSVVFTHGAFGTVPESVLPYDGSDFYKASCSFVALFDHDLDCFLLPTQNSRRMRDENISRQKIFTNHTQRDR